MSKLTPPLKWHGGKNYLAERIIALMPPHTHYVEPYFGGGAVLLNKDPEGISEVVNDINGDLINFWSVLQRPAEFAALRRLCEATPFSEAAFEEASQPTVNPVLRAYRFFIRCRQSRAGTFKDFATLSRNRTRRGMNEQASAWIGGVDGLPAVHARLRRVVILNQLAIEVIKSQDGPKTLYYCDPPYLHETRVVTDAYKFEMTDKQHEELLTVLAGISGKFLLSGYRSEMYDAAAVENGWVRHDFDLPNNAAGGDKKRRMTECVWCNFTSRSLLR